MVFVTVGNATQGFWRLLDAVENLAQAGVFAGEQILIQVGNTKGYKSAHCTQVDFLPLEEFEAQIERANLIISHAGAGTLIQILRSGKVPVVMPRRSQHGELIDDHQLELLETLASEGRIIPAYETKDLPSAVAKAAQVRLSGLPRLESRLIPVLMQTVDQIIQQRRYRVSRWQRARSKMFGSGHSETS